MHMYMLHIMLCVMSLSVLQVCTMLTDRSVRLHEVEISVFSPFRPMLGDRGSPNKVRLLINPLSPHDALKHHFTSLKNIFIHYRSRIETAIRGL